MPSTKHVVVIGAGVGGLAAAIDMARGGLRVTLIERHPDVGGKIRQVKLQGRTVDTGPTVLTMRWVFDELFNDANAKLEERVSLSQLDTLARHHWPDGSTLDLHADADSTFEAIRDFAGVKSAQGFLRFSTRAREVYTTLEDTFIRASQPSALGLVRRSGGLSALLTINPFTTLWRDLGRYFHDPRLRQLFCRYATYCGCSPFLAPATLMLVAHVEMAGVWAPQGGLSRLATAMAALAEEHGAELRLDAHVSELRIHQNRVTSVVLDGGETINTDAVVFNGDPAALGQGLLGQAARPASTTLSVDERSLSACAWAAVADVNGAELARHNVFFSRDYEDEFRQLSAGQLPSDPTVYLCAEDRFEPAAAAPGDERFFAVLNAPARGDHPPWSRRAVVDHASKMHMKLARAGLKLSVKEAKIFGPRDFARDFPGSGGAIYGRAVHGSHAPFSRPRAKTAIVGLYLAGGATHPGAGVPNSALSGRVAARAVLADQNALDAPGILRRGYFTQSPIERS